MADVTPAPGAPAPAAGGAGAPDKAAPPAPPPADSKTAAPPPADAGAAKEKATQDEPGSFLGDAAKEAAKEAAAPPEAPKEGEKKDSTADAGDAYELAMPEGVTADKPLLEAFTAKARELKLPKDQAQALVDVATARAVEASKAAQIEATQRAKEQRAALEGHPEIGGAKLKESQAQAKSFIQRLDRETSGLGSKVVQKLAAAGLGDDPDIAYFFTHQGRRLADDKSVSTTAPAAGNAASPQSVAQERLAKRYPSMNKKTQT